MDAALPRSWNLVPLSTAAGPSPDVAARASVRKPAAKTGCANRCFTVPVTGEVIPLGDDGSAKLGAPMVVRPEPGNGKTATVKFPRVRRNSRGSGMAEDLRHDDADESRLSETYSALVQECKCEEEHCPYTGTSIQIGLRGLRFLRCWPWMGAAIGSVVAASQMLRGDLSHPLLATPVAVVAVIFPGIVHVVRMDTQSRSFAVAVSPFRNLQGEFGRAAQVGSRKPCPEFEDDARQLGRSADDARKPSLTPPEFCFRCAREEIKTDHYEHDADLNGGVDGEGQGPTGRTGRSPSTRSGDP